ncbi:SH3 domain-containing protein, partial [Candidatus Peregrinibacteria bacterium]|nr:SH3 domain-containing protein [Candidatus Peregrinibacteria bacterium]
TASAEDCMHDPIYEQDWNAVVTTGMRVRDIPCMETSVVLTTVPVGTVVHVIAKTDGYYQVRMKDGTEGWVGQWLIEPTNESFETETTVQTKEPLYDIEGHAYETAIRYLESEGVIEGYPDGSYKPSQNVNRAEFVKILVESILDEKPATPSNKCFPDVSNSEWFAPYVCYASAEGIIDGYQDNTFKPAGEINLVEASKILVNTLDLDKKAVPETPWYGIYIEAMMEGNFIPSTFNGLDQKVNRGQMAEMMWRILENKTDQPSQTFKIEYVSAEESKNTCEVPAEAQSANTSNSTNVVGDGDPASCTSEAVVDAIAEGGVITFNCGSDPITIKMDETANIYNDKGPEIVIDGGNLVTLDGQNERRILYMNTCDQDLKWTTPHCDNQDHPRLTVQNITFANGNSTNQDDHGGGAIFSRGGRLKIVNANFYSNACDSTGPDIGGGAIRAFDQYNDKPLYIVDSTFGGNGLGNTCSNGGALSSIGVSYSIYNSVFKENTAIGNGANPAQAGTPGGGSGGAIYNDGNDFNLYICGTVIENNHANEGGGAIFFVSNNKTGNLIIKDSTLSNNPSDGFETKGFPGIYYEGEGDIQTSNSTIN